MVDTALLSVPRARIVEIGGFEPAHPYGHRSDDTYLGALLIAAGCKIAPLRQARGYHLNPPDTEGKQQDTATTAARSIALYQQLLDQPPTNRPLTRRAETGQLLVKGNRLK